MISPAYSSASERFESVAWAGGTEAEPSRHPELRRQSREPRETKVRKVHRAEYWGENSCTEGEPGELQRVPFKYSAEC